MTRRALILGFLVAVTSATWIALPAEARLPRSGPAKADFQRMNPCPSTNASRGPCPGWQIDHRMPLKCGGPDDADNMQWLSIEQHRQKTKREARPCRAG